EQHHVFQTGKPLKLRLKLEKGYDQPRAKVPCDLQVELEHFALTTDSSGKIEQAIPKTATNATLTLKETVRAKGKPVPFATTLDTKIGHLDPVDEPTGQRARLANLGYYRLPLEEVDDDEFKSAIEEFQCEHGLTVDGKCGRQTQDKLKNVHG